MSYINILFLILGDKKTAFSSPIIVLGGQDVGQSVHIFGGIYAS